MSLSRGSPRVEFPGRPLGLPRGRPLDLWPRSALARWAKLLRLLSSFRIGRYLSAGGVDPDGADGIGERGLWGMNGTSESSSEGCVEACASCLELLRPKLLMKSVKPGFDSNGIELVNNESSAVAPGGGPGGRG